ncbi:MAG: DUF3108 domain-containing protein, partial [Candidatus Latescibacteria bacterium]|nr:DUF3108 domain-containing protein [Candidatus Latescibacterota bacterium]
TENTSITQSNIMHTSKSDSSKHELKNVEISALDAVRVDKTNPTKTASSVSTEQPEAATGSKRRTDNLIAYIPEHEMEKSEFIRRDFTPDLIEQYPTGNFSPRTVKNTSWEIGEHLVFDLTYSFYNAGTATMSVIGSEWVNGGECYHIQTTARSNDFISAFYKVRDQVDSYIDKKGIFSRRLEKRLREGGYESDRFVDFYHDRLLALNTKEKYAITNIPVYVQDILSSLYYIRTLDLDVGKTKEIEVYADGQVYTLKVIVHKKEKIEVPAGKFTCYKVEPVLKSEGLFRQKGRLHVWLTDDQYKVPVKMTSKVVIGSIASKLISYQTGIAQ